MEPLTKKFRSGISNSDNMYVPEHILEHMILPHLPFKTLKQFQCISKRFCSLINHDPLFPTDQARLLSPSSTDLVHLSRHGLTFLINPTSIGVPDPSLQFLHNLPEDRLLLCSTNGLLLFYGCFQNSKELICLCNPATQENVYVPTPQRYMHLRDMGLVFNPSITPNQYIIVSLQFEYADDGHGYQYTFDIFRSDNGEWSKSNKRVHQNEPFPYSQKRVHVHGIVYWHFLKFILWYNTEKDLADFIPLPTTKGHWCMGVNTGEVVCCHTWVDGVEIWRLTNGTHWNRLHRSSWNIMSLQWYRWQFFRPLAFDGKFVYLLDFQNRLLDFQNRGVSTEMGAYADILGYDICTRQIEKKGGIVISRFDEQAYDYHNSMAPLPKILG